MKRTQVNDKILYIYNSDCSNVIILCYQISVVRKDKNPDIGHFCLGHICKAEFQHNLFFSAAVGGSMSFLKGLGIFSKIYFNY